VAAKPQQLRVVLHLEQPLKYSKLFPQVIDSANAPGKLRKMLRAIDPHAQIFSQHNTPKYLWRVRIDK